MKLSLIDDIFEFKLLQFINNEFITTSFSTVGFLTNFPGTVLRAGAAGLLGERMPLVTTKFATPDVGVGLVGEGGGLLLLSVRY